MLKLKVLYSIYERFKFKQHQNELGFSNFIGIFLLVVGFYFFNFNFHLLKNENWRTFLKSENTGSWGTFGDYVGGILNPVIAAFAFYLIAKTYELQKTELEETRKLLKVSTDAQNKQIKLAALTASLIRT